MTHRTRWRKMISSSHLSLFQSWFSPFKLQWWDIAVLVSHSFLLNLSQVLKFESSAFSSGSFWLYADIKTVLFVFLVLFINLHVLLCSTGWLQTSVLLCTADCSSYNISHRQAAHTKWNLQSHHKELSLLQDRRQGLAGEDGAETKNSIKPQKISSKMRQHSFFHSPELDPSQPVSEPLLHQSGAVAGGAGERLVLEDRPVHRGQAHRAGLQETKAPGCSLLQDPTWTPLFQVRRPHLTSLVKPWSRLFFLARHCMYVKLN